jgi:Domain of unknown function (DUF4281)
MTADTLFQIANPIPLIGWALLALSPLVPRLADIVAGLIIPLIMAVLYTALALVHFAGSQGDFMSLTGVATLFTNPYNLLAGWVHYLAFDLLIGAWITRTARAERIAHLFVLPCLFLTLMFGPAGFLLFSALRAITTLRAKPMEA